jgi:hypothetical protein
MRGTAVWFALNARLAKLSPYSIALVFSQAQKKITESSASEVQRKLADVAATLRDRRERLEAKRLEQLGEVRGHVIEGELRVKRQRQLLEDLLARGHNTARAQSLLVTMMTSLELMRKHLSLLEQDLPLDDR